jgi:hypothetical protein
MGIEISTATIERNMEIFQKIKNSSSILYNSITSEFLSKGNEISIVEIPELIFTDQ